MPKITFLLWVTALILSGTVAEFQRLLWSDTGKFKASTLPTPGNHEYGIPHAQAYFAYFGEIAGSANQSYYKKQLGTWLILSLNSNIWR